MNLQDIDIPATDDSATEAMGCGCGEGCTCGPDCQCAAKGACVSTCACAD